MITITSLGTGTSQGVPMIACECAVCTSPDPKDKRLRTSILVEQEGTSVVIDTGPDFRQQMLRENVKHLSAVLFTHEHKDHIAGLDDVRAFNYISGQAMDVFASPRVQEALKREFFYVFSGELYILGIRFVPVEVMHLNLPVYGFRMNDFTYITDANFISEEEKEKIKGSKYLVLNALRREKHVSHFTLKEAVDLIEELKPEKAWLIHLSHQMGKHEDINKELPDYIRCAYDGLKLEV